MKILRFIKKIYNRYLLFSAKRSSESYCEYLRSKGIQIGYGTHIDADSCIIDYTRPSLVTIGENCYLNRNFTLLTHDWVSHVFLHCGLGFLNSSGKVTIGNNVGFGQNVIVLKGVSIGDNCFIGANSVVTKSIPSNSVAVGAPAKVIMTLEEYYKKRLAASEAEALEYAKSIQERFNRRPVVTDFWEEFPFFVSGNEVDCYPELPIKRQLGKGFQRYVKEHNAKYGSFEDFLNAAGVK